jgi:predicted transcriptional regulator of viral defense system
MSAATTGIVSVKTADVSHTTLLNRMKSGELERVAHGVYMEVGELPDVMYIAQLRRPRIVFSHDSALLIYDLTDKYPFKHSVTVPTGYNTKTLSQSKFKVFSLKQELYAADIVTMNTPLGYPVKTYNLERTIVDCVRSRSRFDPEIVLEAIKRYVRRTDRNIDLLSRTAERFGVAKVFRRYMEVLL